MMLATRVAYRTSPSPSLAGISIMHMTIKVTYFVYVNPTMRGNCDFFFCLLALLQKIIDGDRWSTRTPDAIVSVLLRFANCAIAPFDQYVRIRIGKTLSTANIHCMVAAANITQIGCRCGSRFLSGLASTTYFRRSPGFLMMQLKRCVVDEAVQIRFFECDLYIALGFSVAQFPTEPSLCRKGSECYATCRSKHAIRQ
jgi:hypothetical protein